MTRMIMIAWPPPAMADSDDIDDGLWFRAWIVDALSPSHRHSLP